MLEIADRLDAFEGEADDAAKDWYFEKMGFVSETKAFGVRDKLNKIQWLGEIDREAEPASVFKVIELSHRLVETNCSYTKLVDRDEELQRKFGVQAVRNVAALRLPKGGIVLHKYLEYPKKKGRRRKICKKG